MYCQKLCCHLGGSYKDSMSLGISDWSANASSALSCESLSVCRYRKKKQARMTKSRRYLCRKKKTQRKHSHTEKDDKITEYFRGGEPRGRQLYFMFVVVQTLSVKYQNLARGPPQLLKKRSENAGACGCPSIPRIAPGAAPRIVVFVLLKS